MWPGPTSTASTPTSTPRSIIRAGVRPPSAAWARPSSRRGARRCPSTAMPPKWRASIRAWTSGATSERHATEPHATLPLPLQAAGLRRGSRAPPLVDLRRVRALRVESRRRPGEEARARVRQDPAESPHDHAQRDPGERPHWPAPAIALATHAGPLRVLLRRGALHDLPRAGPRAQFPPAGGRHREAPLHHHRLHGARAARAARAHFHQRHDAPPRCALAAPASPDLPDRGARGVAFLLAGEARCARAALVSPHPLAAARVPAAAVAAGLVGCAAAGPDTPTPHIRVQVRPSSAES